MTAEMLKRLDGWLEFRQNRMKGIGYENNIIASWTN